MSAPTTGAPCPAARSPLPARDAAGRESRLLHRVEEVQLDTALVLLGHAADMVDDRRVTDDQLRYLVRRMAEALREVHRVAEARGARLPAFPPVGKGEGDPTGATSIPAVP
ncbi:hypothetical protein [Streptomyces sp. ST2-7A]|uniref:hypothetical protein n=1 Tax=Streptomyces sp. ST2-7A TaxID=2907214 RepID=UPI001F389BB8|nr:hypothetical protein [Streptomyces sp. ST2-7A]MCE7082184.1 hypothetical protein [Streptomyces sp. ST2-7A]